MPARTQTLFIWETKYNFADVNGNFADMFKDINFTTHNLADAKKCLNFKDCTLTSRFSYPYLWVTKKDKDNIGLRTIY